MPNWCANELTVSGPGPDLDRFIDAAKSDANSANGEQDLSLASLVPPPTEGYDDSDSADFWYRWNVENWGTKWDVDGEIADRTPTSVLYIFDSAWGPPFDAFATVAANYPTLSFQMKYSEEGMGFYGETIWRRGRRVRHVEGDIDHEWIVDKYGECFDEDCEICQVDYSEALTNAKPVR